MDDVAVRTLKANEARWGQIIHEDIHRFIEEDLFGVRSAHRGLEFAGLRRSKVNLLAGGPPCQPFSKSGYWAAGDSKRLDDPRAKTIQAYFDVLESTLPCVFLLENVPGIAFSEKSEGLDYIRSRLDSINRVHGVQYRVSAAKLNAAEYGVPQLRERVFVIGHREGQLFKFPAPTHGLPPRVNMASGLDPSSVEYTPPCGLKRALTAWDAIGHLSGNHDPELAPRGKWAPVLATIPEGANYLWHTSRGGGIPIWGWRRRYWSMLLKLAKNRPSWTLTAQPGPAIGPFHWENRRLSSKELAALQTFPQDYSIVGNNRDAHKQLGNAVPSALTEILGREIRRQFFNQRVSSRISLLPARAEVIPEPDEILPPSNLPKEILAEVGEHKPHPGTGLGAGALARRSA